MFALRPVVCCASSNSDKKNELQVRLTRIRREWEAKRIDNLKKVQDVIRKTAEDDLETMLAIVRDDFTSKQ